MLDTSSDHTTVGDQATDQVPVDGPATSGAPLHQLAGAGLAAVTIDLTDDREVVSVDAGFGSFNTGFASTNVGFEASDTELRDTMMLFAAILLLPLLIGSMLLYLR